MPQTCIAYGCFNRGGKVEGITFHSFPYDENLRRKWIIATKRCDWEPTKYSKICSAHFREEDIDRTSLSCIRIREGVVPVIFSAFPEESQVKDRRKLKRKTEDVSTSKMATVINKEKNSCQEPAAECSTSRSRIDDDDDDDDDGQEPSVMNFCQILIKEEVADTPGETEESSEELDQRTVKSEPVKRSSIFNNANATEVGGLNSDNAESIPLVVKFTSSTATGEKIHTCDHCGYKTSIMRYIKRHIKTHTEEKSISCELCDFRCSQRSHLTVHLRSHSGEKPFSCNFCDYKCAQSSHLKNHLILHTGEKPFACEFCDYKCTSSANLKKHHRKHSGEKPFSCPFCDYRSAYSNRLKLHISTHSDEKPFICEFCDYRSSNSATLRKHLMKHSGEKPYGCEFCEYRSFYLSDLKKHQHLKHSVSKLESRPSNSTDGRNSPESRLSNATDEENSRTARSITS